MNALEPNKANEEPPTKLTNWKNPPKLADLKQVLLDAQPSHDARTARISNWLDNMLVQGKAKPPVVNGSSQVVPKLIRKQAEWRYPALSEPFLSSEDVFNVRPVSWEDRSAAIQNEMLLNYQFNTQIDKVRFIDEYVRTVVDEGTAIVRVGWEFEEEEIQGEFPTFSYVVDAAFGQTLQQLDAMKVQDYGNYRAQVPEELREAHRLSQEMGQPVRPQPAGTENKRVRTVKNRPTVEVCDFRHVIVDPTCKGDISKAGFVIFRFPTSLSDLKKDPKYKNLEHINLESESVLALSDTLVNEADISSGQFNYKDRPQKKFWVHEYWGYWDVDGSGQVQPIVAAWVGNVMVRMEINPFPDKGLPFVLVQLLPVRRSTHGEPDGALLEDNQKIVGAVTRGMIDIMGKSANGQTGIRKDMLDVANRRKFDQGKDYEFNANVDPRQGIFMHTYPEIPNSAQYMLQMQHMEAESLTGVKSFSQGISANALGDVAAAVRGALDASSKRELGILRRLSAGIITIGRKLIAMNAEFLSEEEVIRVTNDEFVAVRRDDLPGNFDLKLSISTAEEDNNKAEQLAYMLQTIGPNGDPGLTKMVLADIARLRKMPDLAKRIESFQPQPDPMQQQKMQLELALLQAQVQEMQARAMKLQADAQLSGAKSGTEGVKQEHLRSDTDLKNLNFMEQESGVTQERNMQLHGEQARSQAQLKLMEHGIRREEMQHDLVKEYVKARSKAPSK